MAVVSGPSWHPLPQEDLASPSDPIAAHLFSYGLPNPNPSSLPDASIQSTVPGSSSSSSSKVEEQLQRASPKQERRSSSISLSEEGMEVPHDLSDLHGGEDGGGGGGGQGSGSDGTTYVVRSHEIVLPASKYLPESSISATMSEAAEAYGRFPGEGTALVGVISSLFAAAALGSLVGPLAGSVLYEYIAWWLAFTVAAVAALALAALSFHFQAAVQMPSNGSSEAISAMPASIQVPSFLSSGTPARGSRHREADLSASEGGVSLPSLEVGRAGAGASGGTPSEGQHQQQHLGHHHQQQEQQQSSRIAAASASLALISPRSKLFLSPSSASNLTRPFDDTELGSQPSSPTHADLSPTRTNSFTSVPLSPARSVPVGKSPGRRAIPPEIVPASDDLDGSSLESSPLPSGRFGVGAIGSVSLFAPGGQGNAMIPLFFKIASNRRVAITLLGSIVQMLSFGALEAILPFFLADTCGFDTASVGLVFALNGLAYATLAWAAQGVIEHLTPSGASNIGMAILASTLPILTSPSMSCSLVLQCLLMALNGVGYALVEFPSFPFLVEAVEIEFGSADVAVLAAMYNWASIQGYALGPVLAWAVGARLSPFGVMTCLSAMLVCTILITRWVPR